MASERTRPARTERTTRDEIVEVALERVGDAAFEELLKAITPEVLAAEAPWAASTVRYHFRRHRGSGTSGGGALSFQRRDLSLAMLEHVLSDVTRDSAVAAETYEQAAAELSASGSLAGAVDAVRANLDRFTPGAGAEDISARERMYYLALAVADTDSDAARLLRTNRRQQQERFLEVYATYLDALDRELRPGRTLEELACAVAAVLDGHLIRVRFDPGSPGDWVGDAIMAILAAFTTRRGTPPWDLERELLP